MEIFKDIIGYEGLYQVSNYGNVKSVRYNRFLTKHIANNYFIVILCDKAKRKTVKVHRLVAKSFIVNPENKPQVNHINGIKTDNRVDNLEWNTMSENCYHSYYVLGNKHISKQCDKARNKNIKQVIKVSLDGFIIDVFESVTDASKKENVSNDFISYRIKNKLKKTKKIKNYYL